MNKFLLILLIPISTIAQTVGYGNVLSVTPIVDVVYGQTSCVQNTPGSVLGAIGGGVIGSHIGQGTGRAVATIAGAALGSTVGNGPCQYQQIPVTRGYQVEYEFNGGRFSQFMTYMPGRMVQVTMTAR